jgi:hypothetical protein
MLLLSSLLFPVAGVTAFACVADIACVTAVAYNPAVGGIPAKADVTGHN